MKPKALKIGKGLPVTYIICLVLKKIARRQKDKTCYLTGNYLQRQGTNSGPVIRDCVSTSLIKDIQTQKIYKLLFFLTILQPINKFNNN